MLSWDNIVSNCSFVECSSAGADNNNAASSDANLEKGGAGENRFDDHLNRVKSFLKKNGKCCHGTIFCQIVALWSAAVREPTTTTPPPPTPTWRRRSRRKPFRRLSQSGEVISKKKSSFHDIYQTPNGK